MTEDDAKGKWCPFARVVSRVGDGEHVINRSSGNKDHHTLCIAAKCMAWRWREDGAYRIEADAEFRRTGRHKTPTDGFCGLAGAPS